MSKLGFFLLIAIFSGLGCIPSKPQSAPQRQNEASSALPDQSTHDPYIVVSDYDVFPDDHEPTLRQTIKLARNLNTDSSEAPGNGWRFVSTQEVAEKPSEEFIGTLAMHGIFEIELGSGGQLVWKADGAPLAAACYGLALDAVRQIGFASARHEVLDEQLAGLGFPLALEANVTACVDAGGFLRTIDSKAFLANGYSAASMVVNLVNGGYAALVEEAPPLALLPKHTSGSVSSSDKNTNETEKAPPPPPPLKAPNVPDRAVGEKEDLKPASTGDREVPKSEGRPLPNKTNDRELHARFVAGASAVGKFQGDPSFTQPETILRLKDPNAALVRFSKSADSWEVIHYDSITDRIKREPTKTFNEARQLVKERNYKVKLLLDRYVSPDTNKPPLTFPNYPEGSWRQPRLAAINDFVAYNIASLFSFKDGKFAPTAETGITISYPDGFQGTLSKPLKIASGTSGTVYEVTVSTHAEGESDWTKPFKVAIKIPDIGFGDLETFQQIGAMQKLGGSRYTARHIGTAVFTSDSGDPSKRRFPVHIMEFAGRTLSDELNNPSAWSKNPKAKNEFFRQFLDGLVYMKNLGMVHTDLKPANIFLDPFSFGDYDGAQEIKEGETVEKWVDASPEYAAPEIYRKQRSPHSDVFAAAIIRLDSLYGVKKMAEMRGLIPEKGPLRLMHAYESPNASTPSPFVQMLIDQKVLVKGKGDLKEAEYDLLLRALNTAMDPRLTREQFRDEFKKIHGF